MQYLKLIAIVLIVLSTDLLSQSRNINRLHVLSGKSAFGIESGITYTRSDFRNSDIDIAGRLSYEYFFPGTGTGIFGLTAFAGGGYLYSGGGTTSNIPMADHFNTSILFAGAGTTYNIAISESFIPYAGIGLAYLYFNPEIKDSTENTLNITRDFSPHTIIISGEAGIRFMLSDNISFRLSAAVDFVPTDNLDKVNNSVSGGTDRDIFFTALGGFNFYFGGVKDSDNDGVSDKHDLCPDTPDGVIVDKSGCPVDSDKDGVPDYLDQCANTPANIPVNENGCPADSDNDGVPDFRDICPDTPKEVPVDERGCPFDTDGDGVPDYKDICPDTPVGREVDRWGCEIVEEVTTVIPKTKFILSGTLNFETGKSALLPNAIDELNKMVSVLKEYPDTKWRIEGHTDDTGPYEVNKRLSLDRANAVLEYLVGKSISASRFYVQGYGPDKPVADNSTETGRSLNRRVALIMTEDNKNISFTPELTDLSSYNYKSFNEKNVGGMIFTDGKVYTVQVSSWREKYKAENQVKKLKDEGHNAFIIEAELPELDGKWYRVRVGFYYSLHDARAAKEKLKYY